MDVKEILKDQCPIRDTVEGGYLITKLDGSDQTVNGYTATADVVEPAVVE